MLQFALWERSRYMRPPLAMSNLKLSDIEEQKTLGVRNLCKINLYLI